MMPVQHSPKTAQEAREIIQGILQPSTPSSSETTPAPSPETTKSVLPAPAGTDGFDLSKTERILQSTPEAALGFAQRVSKVILHEARRRKWIVTVEGKDYYCIEAWQALGAPYGITASVTKVELLRDETGTITGAMAWAEARHNPSGRIWGEALQVAMADETLRRRDGTEIRRWDSVHALIGMASTRACSRALSQTLRWVATIGGISGTPAEER